MLGGGGSTAMAGAGAGAGQGAFTTRAGKGGGTAAALSSFLKLPTTYFAVALAIASHLPAWSCDVIE